MRWPMQCIELDNAMQCMSHRNGMHGKAQCAFLLDLLLYNVSSLNGNRTFGTAKEIVTGNGTDVSIATSSASACTAIKTVGTLSGIIILSSKGDDQSGSVLWNKEFELGVAGIHTVIHFLKLVFKCV